MAKSAQSRVQQANRKRDVAAARKAGAPPPPAKVRDDVFSPEDGVAWQRIGKGAQGYKTNSKLHSCPVPDVMETYLVATLHLRKNTKGEYKPVGIAVARTPMGVCKMLMRSKKKAVSLLTVAFHLRHRNLSPHSHPTFSHPLRAAARRHQRDGQDCGLRGAVRRAGGPLRHPHRDVALRVQALRGRVFLDQQGASPGELPGRPRGVGGRVWLCRPQRQSHVMRREAAKERRAWSTRIFVTCGF
jgi:hypothetical protein